MAVKFLTEEWMQAVADAANGDPAFTSAAESTEVSLQFHVTEVPDGDDIDYHLVIGEGAVALGPGEKEDADATVTNTYETAAAISKGELNTQTAFMTGKLKVSGNMAKLMMNQGPLNQFAKSVSGVEIDY